MPAPSPSEESPLLIIRLDISATICLFHEPTADVANDLRAGGIMSSPALEMYRVEPIIFIFDASAVEPYVWVDKKSTWSTLRTG